jgi:hypothetical protein
MHNSNNVLKAQDLKIVLIYLGEQVPRYVFLNAIRMARLFNLDTYLFIESCAQVPEEINKVARLSVREISRDAFEDAPSLRHNKKFREGFWFHTIERLLFLKGIHQEFGEKTRILHVEADMLILPSFPFVSSLGNKLKWFRYNEVGDVASLVYLPDISETEWLYSRLVFEMQEDLCVTDMSALRRIRSKHPSRIDVFDDLHLIMNQKSSRDVFDGLSFGMWICGADPRNTYGMQYLHENGSYAPEEGEKLSDLLQGAELYLDDGILRFSRQDLLLDVHCLHIHAKDEKLFYLDNTKSLESYLALSDTGKPILLNFNIKLLMILLLQNLKNLTFVPYCRNFAKFLFGRDGEGERRFRAIVKLIVKNRRPK